MVGGCCHPSSFRKQLMPLRRIEADGWWGLDPLTASTTTVLTKPHRGWRPYIFRSEITPKFWRLGGLHTYALEFCSLHIRFDRLFKPMQYILWQILIYVVVVHKHILKALGFLNLVRWRILIQVNCAFWRLLRTEV